MLFIDLLSLCYSLILLIVSFWRKIKHSKVLKKIHTVRWCKVIVNIHISFISKPTDGCDPALTSVDIKSSDRVTGRSWTTYTDVKIKQSMCGVLENNNSIL